MTTQTLSQLIQIATDAGLTITLNQAQPVNRQRQAVLDTLLENGIKIDRPQVETKLQQPWN